MQEERLRRQQMMDDYWKRREEERWREEMRLLHKFSVEFRLQSSSKIDSLTVFLNSEGFICHNNFTRILKLIFVKNALNIIYNHLIK